MKILHITDNYAPAGGAEYYIYSVCNELEKRGHTNIIIYSNKQDTTWQDAGRQAFLMEGIANFNSSQNIISKALSVVKRENPDIIYLHIINNVLLTKELIRLKPTIQYIHNHNLYCPSAIMSNRFFRCPGKFGFLCFIFCLLCNCRGCKSPNALRRFRIVKANLDNSKSLNALIVASGYMKQRLINNGINADKIFVIPYFTYPKKAYEPTATGNMPIILFAGRVCKFKGLDYLIKALACIKQPYRLIIAGDGYYMNHIRKLAEKLRVYNNIEFLGWLNREELENVYRRATIIVVPSVWPEPFGIVGIEAMSYAKPVVAFDTGGVREWLRDGENGFLVPAKNVHLLSEKITEIIENKTLAEKLGEKGKMISEEKFSPQKHLNLLENIFLNLSMSEKHGL
ncbi:MAG: glycosyltransferase family 4 protein [Candidatus Omnitrophota bacterium]